MTETPSNPSFQFRLRKLFIVTVLVAIPLAGFVVWKRSMDRFFHAMFVGDTGPVNKLEDWPHPLLESIDELDAAGLDRSTLKIHCLCQGFDPEYVWRMDGNAKMFKLLQNKWKLTQVANPAGFILMNGHSDLSGVATPAWWTPKQDGQTAFYVCPQELARDKGDRFQVAFDQKSETIFVHYWFNF